MKRVFLDTNILLDAILRRSGFLEAAEIMNMGDEGKIEVYASLLTFANAAYILRKYSRGEMYDILADMTECVTVLPMDDAQLHAAIENPATDFEDMLQYQCAKANGCDAVVTNNTRHWNFSNIPVFTSQEYLEACG